MTVFNQRQIHELYESNCAAAIQKLSEIPAFCGKDPKFTGLRGWVFEQTIQCCLRQELEHCHVKIELEEQVAFHSRIKADLRTQSAIIEIKVSGAYGRPVIEKYARYRKLASADGLAYLYLTGREAYKPYHEGMIQALGPENAFFLDTDGEWERFVRRIIELFREPTSR